MACIIRKIVHLKKSEKNETNKVMTNSVGLQTGLCDRPSEKFVLKTPLLR